MKTGKNGVFCLMGLLALLCTPAYATVTLLSLTSSVASPQPVGTSITWTATGQENESGPLTFQFSVAYRTRGFAIVQDFNVGTQSAGTWISQPFVWVPTGFEGTYQIQVVIKNFTTRDTATKQVRFKVNPLVSGSNPVVVATGNPLVALFSAPSCASGSSMRVVFQQHSKVTPATMTNAVSCHPPNSMTFEIAGMYPTTIYDMNAQTITSSTVVNGPTVRFITGSIPAGLPLPSFSVNVAAGPQTDKVDSTLLYSFVQLSGTNLLPAATDLKGKIKWYYAPSNPQQTAILTRPLSSGRLLTIQNGVSWNPASAKEQLLIEIDLAGNVIRGTNTGAIQQQLLAMGSVDGGPCDVFPSPAPVGSACLGSFHHDAIHLPNGFTAVLGDIEKIFPAGTQGDTSGLPVDVIGDMIIVLDANWQVSWYWDSFDPAGGGNGYPQLPVSRTALLRETCTPSTGGCPPVYLLGPGIAPSANDWLHGNTIYFWPQNGDLLFSSRSQDWVMKIDYQNGAPTATGNILWRMGPCGDFTNTSTDSWPWFSHQHEVGLENNGAGPLTLFDNGNTRVSPAGSSTGCISGVGSGNSRGMALTVDETNMQVTPVLSVDLGNYSLALGSAQLLSNGNYFFLSGLVVVSITNIDAFAIETLPNPSTGPAAQVLNLQNASTCYRAWQMASLYAPPIT